MHQHRFRDALQTSRGCWALREPTRKERAGEKVGRGRARARGCALPPARSQRRLPGLGRAWDGGGRGGSSRSLSPLLLSSRVTGRTVWERPRSTRIFERSVGEGRAAAAAQRKTKSASSRLFDTRQLTGGTWTPRLRLPLPSLKTSQGGRGSVWRGRGQRSE